MFVALCMPSLAQNLQQNFQNPPQEARPRVWWHWMNGGKVCVMAEVFVNGQNMGVVWKAPFKLDITSALKPGKNDLKVIVTNLWVNRLIGDAQPGVEKKKIIYTSLQFYQADAPLQPSGMMGPVKLIGK